MYTFNVDVVLRGQDRALTEAISVPHGEPAGWAEEAVYDVLVEILRAIDRAQNPDAAAERQVVLRGFSWIVEPSDSQVVIAIEIPMGAAVAGPFAIGQNDLDSLIRRVLRAERPQPPDMRIH